MRKKVFLCFYRTAIETVWNKIADFFYYREINIKHTTKDDRFDDLKSLLHDDIISYFFRCILLSIFWLD